jgi:hypothetical protein
MSSADLNHGRPLVLDFLSTPAVEFYVSPPLDDVRSLYLVGFLADNCSADAIKVTFTASGLNPHKSMQGVPVRNTTTGALIVNPASGASNLPFFEMMNQGNGVFNSDISSFTSQSITLLLGDTSTVPKIQDYHLPKPVSHDFSSRIITQVRCSVTDLYGQAVTFDHLVLDLVAFPKEPAYQDLFVRGAPPGVRAARDAMGARYA